ncbi:Uncharacterised protein [Bordetella pertussis]|nr:Uncharacterised protein [Bordetella pertussis]CFU81313.1 Uncharacterised protein [Bordetella pertussis]CPL65381.1 Uncharacterised protein [Bordetella pertussis]CPM65592.1 Uncharacterised protein [Bordetella pertussis]CPO22542.1 Uncharacterised protein [Bordetella pertussis]
MVRKRSTVECGRSTALDKAVSDCPGPLRKLRSSARHLWTERLSFI